MAKHNSNSSSSNSNNNGSNNSSKFNNAQQGATMSNAVNNIQQILDQAKEVAKNERKAGNLKKTEYAKLLKEQNKEIQAEKDALYLVLQGMRNNDDEIIKLQIKQTSDLNIAKIKESYKPRLEALKLDVEEILQAGGAEAGEFIGGGVAKVSKPVGSFISSFAERAGIKAPWSK